MDNSKKMCRFDFRLKEKEFNKIKTLANIYAGGNITKWLTHGGINAPRMFLTDKEEIMAQVKANNKKALSKLKRARKELDEAIKCSKQ